MATSAKIENTNVNVKHRERVFEIMHDVDFCMLTTFGGGNAASTRPMSTIVDVDGRTIYMLSEKDQKIADMQNSRRVLLNYSDGSKKFVALEGNAIVHDDRKLVASLWNPGAQVFWPQGADDPNIVAVEVIPIKGEYWDGHNAIVSTWKFAASIATGETAEMGDHEVVKFPSPRK